MSDANRKDANPSHATASQGGYRDPESPVGVIMPTGMTPDLPSSAVAQRRGFLMSRRRIGTELLAVALLGVVLVGGGLWLARTLSDRLVGSVPISVDRKLGDLAAAAMGGANCDDDAALAYVQATLNHLLTHAPDQPHEFRIRVADVDAVNAFAAPGGVVVINRGLLAKAQSGDEVAAVIAHEIQHVLLRHSVKTLLREAGVGLFVRTLIGSVDLEGLGGLATDLAGRAYSRDHEREADAQGRALMKAAGADPAAMARFFSRLAAAEASVPPILSTHPGHDERVRAAEAEARDFVPTYAFPAPPAAQCM